MNIWSEAKSIVGTVAPSIAALLGGPLAGTAAGAIVSALGLDPSSSPQQVTAALKAATPDQLLALKKADDDFQIQLKQAAIEWEKLDMTDVADARSMRTSLKDPFPTYLGAAIVLGFFATVFLVLSGFSKVTDSTIAGALIGYVSAKAEQVVAYFFGSSTGSKEKDAMLYASSPIQPPPTQPEARQ